VSNADRQIVNMLDTIHREMFGTRTLETHCQWYYDGKTDIYHCPHTAVFGKEVIGRIPPHHVEPNPAQEAWDATPESQTHPL